MAGGLEIKADIENRNTGPKTENKMRTLALDVGTKTIGVAVSDEQGTIANGVTTIKRKELKSDLRLIGEFIEKYHPSEILVGIPYNTDGVLSERGKKILKFSNILERAFFLPVRLWDESFSTADAEEVLLAADVSRRKRKKVVDKMAAVLILQSYLETKRIKKD